MSKVVDIESLKNKYFHRIGTQFDNAILVAENEFLIDAYTKADIEKEINEVLDKIRAKIAKRTIEQGFHADEWSISYDELMKIIDKCKKERSDKK